jgi:pimeloyl-ACP methyl ester carboxylesterase
MPRWLSQPSGVDRAVNRAWSVDGCGLAWFETGKGPAILLVHGFASTLRRNWLETGWFDALAGAGCRVIAYDQRGHGASDKRYDPADYAPDRLVADALGVLDAAGAGRAALMGYSMGARVALDVAITAPARVHGLVLSGMGMSFCDFGGPEHDREIIARALEADDPSAFPPSARFYRTFAEQSHADRRALAACWRRSIRVLDPSALGAVSTPTLLVVGDRDAVAGDPEPLARAMKQARVVRLAGKDHMNAVGAKEHRAAVLAFLEQLAD